MFLGIWFFFWNWTLKCKFTVTENLEGDLTLVALPIPSQVPLYQTDAITCYQTSKSRSLVQGFETLGLNLVFIFPSQYGLQGIYMASTITFWAIRSHLAYAVSTVWGRKESHQEFQIPGLVKSIFGVWQQGDCGSLVQRDRGTGRVPV